MMISKTAMALLITAAILFLPCPGPGEFYEFIDENGVRTFTDDPGLIPEADTPQVLVHKEPYDDLPEEERELRRKADHDRLMTILEKRNEELRRLEKKRLIRDLEEEKARKARELEQMRTPVTISNNQILVPVTVTYRGNTLAVTLLLDTGASITTLNHDAAERLSVTDGRRSAARVADGSVVRTLQVTLDTVSVGPKSRPSHTVQIIPFKGPSGPFDGLLGLDFLRHFPYDIDYRNHLIVWKE
ncbi:hypothetical protein JCM14469_15700 [Desulfatiferula olefinivorans]